VGLARGALVALDLRFLLRQNQAFTLLTILVDRAHQSIFSFLLGL
jgi:hypothetical protein